MFLIRELLSQKGGAVHSVSADRTVHDAAVLMNEARIGALVVLEGASMVGILTERDILTRIVAPGVDPATTRVDAVMTSEVRTASPDDRISDAKKIMREQRIRHLPVLDGDRIAGMVSIGDLNAVEHETLVETIKHMETYIAGGMAM